MLNLTDHLRRLRVDKYEYVAMKVIVLLQSGEKLANSIDLSFYFVCWRIFHNENHFSSRYIWFKRTRTSSGMPRKSIACTANIYISSLSWCTIEVRWTASANTRVTTHLSGTVFWYRTSKFLFCSFFLHIKWINFQNSLDWQRDADY